MEAYLQQRRPFVVKPFSTPKAFLLPLGAAQSDEGQSDATQVGQALEPETRGVRERTMEANMGCGQSF